jgi:Flp pilus assembly protein TadD
VLGALVIYGVTLAHGVTMNSLELTAKVAGWDWLPMVGQPLLWLLTLPLRFLPAACVPLGLNLFSVVTAAFTLGLLARTVQLLPWDQPWESSGRLSGHLPAMLACVMCGLELSFWQEATAASGEMLDMLLLAATLWLLLEYRSCRKAGWLNAATFIWGVGMAENWLMMLLLPLFVGGVIWLRGRRFFRKKFLLRLAGLGLAGFSFYAVLPLVNGLAPHSLWSFGQSWLVSLRQTKGELQLLYYQFWMAHRLLMIAVMIYFLMPLLACLVRQRDESTKKKPRADRFQIWIYRGLRGLLLLACLWLAFDPINGPREIIQSQFGISAPLLAFDYLNALGAAFLAGNLLLITLGKLRRRRRSRFSFTRRKLTAPFAIIGLTLVAIGLMTRNAPDIWHTNHHTLEHFGELAVGSLPAGRGVMMSGQPQKLEAFQAALSHHWNRADWLAVDTRSLPTVAYRAWLERHQPAGWLTDESRHELTALETAQLLEKIAGNNRLFCLHPSYGNLFERFYLEPVGAVYEMKLRGKNPLLIPPMTTAVTDANDNFWTGVWQAELAPLVIASNRHSAGWQRETKRYGITSAPFYQDQLLAKWYSLSLDGWGVFLQQQGHWNEARLRLKQALQLNPDNFSAQISLACNTNLQSAHKLGLAGVDQVANQLGSFQRLDTILNNCGPFDEPVFCYLLGCGLQKAGMLLQAAEQFERTRMLAPGTLAPELALAKIYTRLQFTDYARPLLDHLRDKTRNLPANNPLDLEVKLLEADSWLAQTNSAKANNVIQSILQQNPGDVQIANSVISAYLAYGDYPHALQIIDTRLAQAPDDVASLNLQADIFIQSGHAADAIPVLNHILTLTNLPAIRLNRALARLASQDFEAAEIDFQQLEKTGTEPGRVDYGLAMIAEHRGDTNQTQYYLRLCLTNTPAGSVLWQKATISLQAFESASQAKSLK